jgi:hypothetical protein
MPKRFIRALGARVRSRCAGLMRWQWSSSEQVSHVVIRFLRAARLWCDMPPGRDRQPQNARSLRSRCLTMPRYIRHAAGFLLLAAASACGAGDVVPTPPPAPDLTRRPAPKLPGSDDFAERTFTEPLSLQDAEAVLKRTRVFGFGGMPPKRQVQAFNVVFEQSDAVARFRSLGTAASAAGQLYSLA